ncbi:hypothetical protein Dimus_024119 [Dionaea muscipula]
MASSKPFKGSNIFMSRNLVPPELFDSLHDVVKLNGAEVFLCCDPSRNGPDDFHIISSSDHEKFVDLRAKGCNLLGPQCILSCAKERRALPKQGFTCCLAMDGIKVLASGFDQEERGKLGKFVIAMGGILHTKMSLDVSFVIVKNVRAAKYKWAVHVKKPVVTINWLYQCWSEHRIVPQESYRVPPFSGLVICVTRIPADERKKMEQVIAQNGGKYSAELTKICTHLICDAPEGDKYKVARKWGHISIVTRKWYDQSIAKSACLSEEAFPVSQNSVSSMDTVKGCLTLKHGQEKSIGYSQSAQFSLGSESKFQGFPTASVWDSEVDAILSQNFHSTVSNSSVFVEEAEGGVPLDPPTTDSQLDACVADDSQTEDDDLYLSDCRVCLVGFDSFDMQKLVNLVRRGGGSRFVSYSERLTHIVVGCPSDLEKKDLRGLAALGVIHVVKPIWLEECDRRKKEIPVTQRHIAYDALHPQELAGSSKKVTAHGFSGLKQGKCSTVPSSMPIAMSLEVSCEIPMLFNKDRDGTAMTSMTSAYSLESPQNCPSSASKDKNTSQKFQHDVRSQRVDNKKSSAVFTGRKFYFSDFFPQDRRDEVFEWINEGGGEIANYHIKEDVDFIVECHGIKPQSSLCQATYVSTHWIRSCLEDGCILDVGSHILYSPLPCQIPLLGFECFRFCVSQYEGKDRLLLRNLCFVLGAKFVESLTRKVTHLLCKFSSGRKYEYARKYGIQSVRCEWIYECVKKNRVVPLEAFFPKEVSAQDLEAGLCNVSQYPTQATKSVSANNPPEISSLSAGLRKPLGQTTANKPNNDGNNMEYTGDSNKKPKLQENLHSMKALSHCLRSDKSSPICRNTTENSTMGYSGEKSLGVDVADAIEDLLEQTSKIHDLDAPGETDCTKAMFSPDCPILPTDHLDSHSGFELSKHWLGRSSVIFPCSASFADRILIMHPFPSSFFVL